jgi:hypothetical protein
MTCQGQYNSESAQALGWAAAVEKYDASHTSLSATPSVTGGSGYRVELVDVFMPQWPGARNSTLRYERQN